MSKMDAPSVALPTVAQQAPEFYCAEIWGGNRPMDGPIDVPGARGWVYSHACEGGRGGDIHYVSLCSSGLISRFCLADVAGHGEAVAKVSDEIHTLLRRYMNTLDQRRVLAELNRRLEGTKQGTMTTAAVVTYFPPAHRLSVSYAGHPPGWLYRQAEGQWSRLVPQAAGEGHTAMRDLPLAIFPQTSFSRRKERTRNGDRVLVVTDGVLEAPAPGGELFGDARLAQVLEEHAGDSVEALVHAVLAAVTAHTHDERLPHDDVTLMLLELVPGPRALGIWHGLKRRLLPRPRAVKAS
jgi:sigma-B regulation protein RsbU (phosphoserine phosphatase)